MLREQPAKKENSKCQMLRHIDPALLPGELVPRRRQSAPGRRNKEALPENPEVMSTMQHLSAMASHCFFQRHCQGCGKSVATPPDLRLTPPTLGFQKQKAPVPFGLSSGSCSSLGCFHFLHSTRHPEKMTHLHKNIFSFSEPKESQLSFFTQARLW